MLPNAPSLTIRMFCRDCRRHLAAPAIRRMQSAVVACRRHATAGLSSATIAGTTRQASVSACRGGVREMCDPVARDIQPPRHPDPANRADMVEQSLQPRRAAPGWPIRRMCSADRQHVRLGRALRIQEIERVAAVMEEIVAGRERAAAEFRVVGRQAVGHDQMRLARRPWSSTAARHHRHRNRRETRPPRPAAAACSRRGRCGSTSPADARPSSVCSEATARRDPLALDVLGQFEVLLPAPAMAAQIVVRPP